MARSLNGSTQYCEVTSAPVTALPCTFSCWIYPTAVSRYQAALSITKGTDATNNEQLRVMVYDTNVVECASFTGPSAFTAATTAGTVSVNTWHHVAGTFSASAGQYAWLNGTKSSSGGNSQSPSGLARANIGRVYTINTQFFPWQGRIALAGIWSVVLTDDEIGSLYTGRRHPRSVRPDALVAAWDLGGFAGENDRDNVGGYHLTPYPAAPNAPTWADSPPIWYPQGPISVVQGASASAATPWLYRSGRSRVIGGGVS